MIQSKTKKTYTWKRSGFKKKSKSEICATSSRKKVRARIKGTEKPVGKNVVVAAQDYARQLAMNPTKAEQKLYELLYKEHINFIFQYPLYIVGENRKIERFYIVDFFLPASNLIIEVDGEYHQTLDQQYLDEWRTEDITKCNPNIRIERITNEEVLNPIKLKNFLIKIKNFVK